MKINNICLTAAAFVFISLLTSCAFLQKGEFAQRKYYNFPRTKHTDHKTASVVAQDKAPLSVTEKEKHLSTPLVSASANKKEIIPATIENRNPERTASRTIHKIEADEEKAEEPAIHFRKSEIRKQAVKSTTYFPGTDPDAMLVILVILAIFIPPLAVYLKSNEVNKWFWITLLLCLFGGGLFFGSIGYGFGLLWAVAVVIAILYVLDRLQG